MRILIDMNLTARWVPFFAAEGYDAVHWSSLGPGEAPDVEIFGAPPHRDTLIAGSHGMSGFCRV
jgi:predicted nuclease of predicted toxin-antitoxin system